MSGVEVMPEILSQRSLDLPICNKILQRLKADMSEEDIARLNGICVPHAGDWLHAPPIVRNGLWLTNEELRTSTNLRLGLPMYQPHPCICGAIVDSKGSHALVCKRNGGKTSRHSAMNALIQRELAKANVRSTLEPANLIPESPLRPDGVSIISWSTGRQLVWDFTCVNPLAMSYLSVTHGVPGKASTIAEERKTSKYIQFNNQFVFTPIAIETLGAYGPSAIKFFKSLAKRQCEVFGYTEAATYMHQRISLELQRANSKCLLWALQH